MSHLYYLLGQTSGGQLAQEANNNAIAVAEGFNQLWERTISGEVYTRMCTVGALFAVATLTFFIKDQPAPVPVSVDQKVVPSNPPSPRPAPHPVQNTQPRRVTQTAPQQIRAYTPPTRTSFSPRPSIAARTFTPEWH